VKASSGSSLPCSSELTLEQDTRTGWRRCICCLKLNISFHKRAKIIGLFCGKWLVKMRHPMGLRHSVHAHMGQSWCIYWIRIPLWIYIVNLHCKSISCVHIVNIYCNLQCESSKSALWIYIVNLHRDLRCESSKSIVWIYNVNLHCESTLWIYIANLVNLHCESTLWIYSVNLHCESALQIYIVNLHCESTLWVYIVNLVNLLCESTLWI